MKSLVLAFTVSALLFPSIILAQNEEQNSGLVPCGYGKEYDCGTDDVVNLANGLIEFLISMLGVIAVIALVYSGFRMVMSAGNETEWRKAKETFSNIVIGIIIILSAWLVVDLVLSGLTETGGLNEWLTDFSV